MVRSFVGCGKKNTLTETPDREVKGFTNRVIDHYITETFVGSAEDYYTPEPTPEPTPTPTPEPEFAREPPVESQKSAELQFAYDEGYSFYYMDEPATIETENMVNCCQFVWLIRVDVVDR